MAEATSLQGHTTETAADADSFDVLWLTAGLSCDGDTISITAATQPSLEDLVLGAIPGIPKLRLHNPVLAYANGDEYLQQLHDAAEGKLALHSRRRRLHPERKP